MQFLADVELVCEECKGTRFKQQILDIRYRGKNVHEVLKKIPVRITSRWLVRR